MRSVLPKIIQNLGIKNELIKADEIILKISCKGSKCKAEEVLKYIKSSVLSASNHREKLHSLKTCSKMSDIRAHDRPFGIEMTVVTIGNTIRDGVEEEHIF